MRAIALSLLVAGAFVKLAGARPAVVNDAYRLVFADEFETLSLSPDGLGDFRWYPGLPWNPKLPALSLITHSDSALQLLWSRSGTLPETSISTVAHDLKYSHAFCQGYFEARMSWRPTAGAWPAFWLAALDGMKSPAPAGEIDIFEGIGSQPAQYSAAIHIWKDFGKTETFKAGGEFPLSKDNDFEAWHTYGLLWESGHMKWYYDDHLVYSIDSPKLFDRQMLFLLLGSQAGVDWTYGNLRGVTADEMKLKVDWVRVWQRKETEQTQSNQ